MSGWNTANYFSDSVGFEDVKQPLHLWNGDSCACYVYCRSQFVEHQFLGNPQQISKKQQSIDIEGPFDFFRQGEINSNVRFDLHTEAECSTSSGMVTTRDNTKWDTTSQR